MATEIGSVLSGMPAVSGFLPSQFVGAKSSEVGATASRPEMQSVPSAPPASRVNAVYAALERLNDQSGEIAAQMQSADKLAGQVSAILGKMDALVREFIKYYPPFLQESPERLEFLNSLTGLRKQIDALTYPPPEDFLARRMLGLPDLSGAGGHELPSLPDMDPVPLHSGRNGLDLPDFQPFAQSDEMAPLLLDKIAQGQDKVGDFKDRLAEVGKSLGVSLEDELRSIMGLPETSQSDASEAGRAGQDERMADMVETLRGQLGQLAGSAHLSHKGLLPSALDG